MSSIQTDIYNYLENGAKIQLDAVGVSFPCMYASATRQDILADMYKQDNRSITLSSQTDNEYDEFAVVILNDFGVDIGFIPKRGVFDLFINGRKRPAVLGHEDVGMCINELFHKNNSGIEEYVGEITKFKSYSFKRGEGNLGVAVEFWLPTEDK
jgi:hypothetical protein